MNSKSFRHIFDKIITESHDSLWIDLTEKTPLPLRKNGFIPLHKKDKNTSVIEI